ncbi:hypothetical protein [Nocardia sp. NPDC051833]|uniref:hypothetical protein n=1 Tax=Nocardia sp. NPDC051833 TaxID=3155674 RepID=UPI00343D0414
MTDTCTCPPGDCHGGHTIDIGPSWVCVADQRLRALRDDPWATRPRTALVDDETRSMAAELLALRDERARRAKLYVELEAERDLWKERAEKGQLHRDDLIKELNQQRARVTELEAATDRVREVHQPVDALNVRYPGGRRTQVCAGCGTDDGNWQMYPCPTIRALSGPRPAPSLIEVPE